MYYESRHRGQGKRIICKEPRKSFIDQIYSKGTNEKKFLNYSNRVLDSQTNLYDSEFWFQLALFSIYIYRCQFNKLYIKKKKKIIE